MSYGPNSLKGNTIGDYIGEYYGIGVIDGDTSNLDYSSHDSFHPEHRSPNAA